MTQREVFSRDGDFQRIDSLKRNRRKRSKTGLVFVEGVQAINCALENAVLFEAVVVDGERRLSTWAEDVIRQARAEVIVLHNGLMASLSDKEEPSELVAIVHRPMRAPDSVASHPALLLVVLDRPRNEGNLGSIVRSANAFQADAVIATGHGVDAYDPKTIRASIGTIFHTPVMHCELPRLKATLERLRRELPALQIVGTSARHGASIRETDSLRRPCVLMLGNETNGLSKAMTALCTEQIRIPMAGSASSLNVVAAASILMYEVARDG